MAIVHRNIKTRQKKLNKHHHKGGGVLSRIKGKEIGIGKSGSKWWQKAYKSSKGQSSTRVKLGKGVENLKFITSKDGAKSAMKFELSSDQKVAIQNLQKVKTKKGKQALKEHLDDLQHKFEVKGDLGGAKKLSQTVYGKKKFLGSIRGRDKTSKIDFKRVGDKDVVHTIKTKGNNGDGLVSTSRFTYGKTGNIKSVKKTSEDTTKTGSRFGKGTRTVATKYDEDGKVRKISRTRGFLRGKERTKFKYKGNNKNEIGIVTKTTGYRYGPRSKVVYTSTERAKAMQDIDKLGKDEHGKIIWTNFKGSNAEKQRLQELHAQHSGPNMEKYTEYQMGKSKVFKDKEQGIKTIYKTDKEQQKKIKEFRETQTDYETAKGKGNIKQLKEKENAVLGINGKGSSTLNNTQVVIPPVETKVLQVDTKALLLDSAI